MMEYRPERILLEKKVESSPLTQRVLQHWTGVPVELVNEAAEIRHYTGKQPTLALIQYKGRFIKPCPGTPRHICCNYLILNIGYNCPLACSYCYLPAYLENPHLITLFANLEDMLGELKRLLASRPTYLMRIGTGEFTDSLIFDQITRLSETLIPLFSHAEGYLLELKTKTSLVDHLLELGPKQRVIISWSLNTSRIIEQEEPLTASLEERLLAAQACQRKGYWIGLHLDPLVHYEGWMEDYSQLLRLTFSYLDPSRIIWISLGGLRFLPELPPLIKERFPHCRIILGELFPGQDKKLRYLQKIRIELYTTLAILIRNYAPQTFIYLCMETPIVWRRSLGWSPQSDRHLARLFAQHFQAVRGTG